MRITRAVVPSLFTTLNLFFGFLSIVYAHLNDLHLAAWFIILAAVCDALDGMMARLTGTASRFGVELDSLADVVSFGAAPAFLVFKSSLFAFNQFGILVSAMLLIFGAIRLARFNTQLMGFDKDHFSGLPIPFSAMTISAFVLQYYVPPVGFQGLSGGLLVPLVLTLSLLMVSKIRYDTLPKFKKKEFEQHPVKMTVFILGFLVIAVSGGSLFFEVLLTFILFGIVRHIFTAGKRKKRLHDSSADVKEEKISSIDI